MEPGQLAVTAGLWGGVLPGGVESQLFVGAELPVSHRVSIDALAGLQMHTDGAIDARDALLAATWLPLTRSDLTVRVRPGLSIPTGGLSSRLQFTPLSTASFDPWLGVDVLYGSAWVGGVSAVARVPLYEGWDQRRQGPFLRADLRLARRAGTWIPWAGVSAVDQLPSSPASASPAFGELAAIAGVIALPHERWSVTAQARAPVWISADATRAWSAGVAVRTVLGNVPEGHEH